MSAIRIIEYEPKYAQSIAFMWNESRAFWGGDSNIRTAEAIRREHETSTDLHVFLALDGEEVVGYCSFSEYKRDVQAMYVPLLNVRPDYHGKKVGKALILKAIETTIEKGYPRLDLFTWPGNTKAVPMYKKCGFFWENRDQSTHLMNFIPLVLQTEALKPYFEKIHWYKDSVREIEVRPDGRKENGFDFYTYTWAKDSLQLRVELERTGRGIRLVETDEYLIYCEIENHGLVFGSSYPVRYYIYNKSSKPLSCLIQGMNDQTIRFAMSEAFSVENRCVVEGQFEVLSIHEEQNEAKTHPAVAAQVTVNGKKIVLRTGIQPKFPAKLSFLKSREEDYLHISNELLLTIENEYWVPTEFHIVLPELKGLKFISYEFTVTLSPKGKDTLVIPYELIEFGLYTASLIVEAMPEDEEQQIVFTKELQILCKGHGGMFGGEMQQEWVIANGAYSVHLRKNNNEMYTRHFRESYDTFWLYPKLGLPYTSEYSQKRADDVLIYTEGASIVMRTSYYFSHLPSLRVSCIVKLQQNGLIERYFELENKDEQGTIEQVSLLDGCYHSFYKEAVIPYNGEIVQVKEQASNTDLWDYNKITENWLFAKGKYLTRGLCWDSSLTPKQNDWHMGFGHHYDVIPAGRKERTPSIYLAIGTFPDWFDFRSFALKQRDEHKPIVSDHFSLSVAGGNPFVSTAYGVHITDRKKNPLDGTMILTSRNKMFKPLQRVCKEEENLHQVKFNHFEAGKGGAIDVVDLCYESAALLTERETIVFHLNPDAQIQQYMTEQAGKKVYHMNNGSLQIAASPSFGNTLHSLIYRDCEWLDTSYPKSGARSWWNPWFGGIATELPGISEYNMLQEKRKMSFVTLLDNKQNEWHGIQIHTVIDKHDKSKGLELVQYYLMLPSSPVLCSTNQVINRSGQARLSYRLTTSAFLLPDESLMNSWLLTENRTKIRGGTVGTGQDVWNGLVRFGSDRRPDQLYIATNDTATDAYVYTNNEIMQFTNSHAETLPGHGSFFTRPIFYFFDEKDHSHASLKELVELKFGDYSR